MCVLEILIRKRTRVLLDALNKVKDAVVHGGRPSTEPLVAARDRTSTFCVNCFLDGGSLADASGSGNRAMEIFSTTAVSSNFLSVPLGLGLVSCLAFASVWDTNSCLALQHIAHRERLSRGVRWHVNHVTSVLHVV